MSLKAKLVSTIAAFVMVLALMVVGVLAATNSKINMSGSISFTAQDIVGSVTLNGEGLSKSATFDSTQGEASYTWDDLNLVFDKADGTMELELVITNNATDGRKIKVTFTTAPAVSVTPNVVTVNTTSDASGAETVSKDTSFEVAHGTPVTVTITFNCSDFNSNFTGSWNSVFTLANVAAPAAAD